MSLIRPEELSREGESLVQAATALAVVDDEAYAEAGERRKIVKLYLARVDEVMGPIVEAAHKAHKIAVQQRDTLKKPALDADEIYKTRRLDYETAQEADARARAAAEQKRLQTEEETRRLDAAVAAEARGDANAAEKILAAPVIVFAPPVASGPPKVEGIAARTDWDFVIEDPALIPRQYLAVDEKKIRGVVRALKAQAVIPGVRVFLRRNESVRAR